MNSNKSLANNLTDASVVALTLGLLATASLWLIQADLSLIGAGGALTALAATGLALTSS